MSVLHSVTLDLRSPSHTRELDALMDRLRELLRRHGKGSLVVARKREGPLLKVVVLCSHRRAKHLPPPDANQVTGWW